MSSHNEDILQRFRQDKATKAVVWAIDYYFQAYFPQLWNLYSNILNKIYVDNPDLKCHFKNCMFAGYTLNFEHVNTYRYHDYLNLLFKQCTILSLSDFNYKMGGHLVLWDLGLAFEFLLGCIMLIPSAMLEHSNVAIRPTENRSLFTLYSASGLFHWVHNGCMSDKDFAAHAPPDVLEGWNKHWDELLQVGLDILHGKACKNR
uniref:Uncharacterized protein n=1 Tax=Moniliophthora roreri TaxID=221103 RepID=A0A0W0G103_MONRR